MSVDGSTTIEPRPRTHTIRYLGVWLNLSLTWQVQVNRMARTVYNVCASIKRGSFTIPMSAFTVTQFLIPRLRLGIRSAKISRNVLRGWDTQIKKAVCSADKITQGGTLDRHCFFTVSGVPSLEDQQWIIRGEDLMVALNSDYDAARTCRVRLSSASIADRGAHASRARTTWEALENVLGATLSDEKTDREQPNAAVAPGPWQPWHESWSDWDPYRPPTLTTLRRAWTGGTIGVYTDGSTGASKRDPSGFSAVVTIGTTVLATARGACRASGNNFLAEAVGILYALHLTPSSAPVFIGSDSKAAIGATNKHRIFDWLKSPGGEHTNDHALPQRARAISAARPVMNMIREMIKRRQGPVTFGHVRAHTQGRDFGSRMNDIADHEANCARMEWIGRAPELDPWLSGEDRFRIQIGGFPVDGSYRNAIKKRTMDLRFQLWAGGAPPKNPVYAPTGGGRDPAAQAVPQIPRVSPMSGFTHFPANLAPIEETILAHQQRPHYSTHQKRLIRSNPIGMKGIVGVVRKSRTP